MRYVSARQMIFDAYQAQHGSVMAGASEIARLGAQIQHTKRNNNDWRIVNGLEAGAVISAVESLPPHLHAMALYLFGPFTRDELDEIRETVEIALYRQVLDSGVRLPGQGSGPPTSDMHNTLRYLCCAALYHHGQVTWPYQRQGLQTPKAVQRWMADEYGVEIETRFWSRRDRTTWGSVWEHALCIVDSWECECLAPVAALVAVAA